MTDTQDEIKTTVIDGIEVIYTKPPVWDSVVATFQVIPATAVFTYGNRIYNPSGAYIADHVIEHEKVHMNQQARLINHAPECNILKTEDTEDENRCSCGQVDEGAALWWGKFLRDSAFRIDQETEAYAFQYAFVCYKVKDRNARVKFLTQIAQTLAGPLYGRAISFNEAMSNIKSRSGVQ